MLVPIGAWSAIHAALAAIVLFVSLIGGSVFWVLRHIHKRLRNLEEGNESKQDALFGIEKNPLHVGLTREVSELKDELDEIQSELDEALDDRQELREQWFEVKQKLDELEKKLEQLENDD